jgi:hypothetical protein
MFGNVESAVHFFITIGILDAFWSVVNGVSRILSLIRLNNVLVLDVDVSVDVGVVLGICTVC